MVTASWAGHPAAGAAPLQRELASVLLGLARRPHAIGLPGPRGVVQGWAHSGAALGLRSLVIAAVLLFGDWMLLAFGTVLTLSWISIAQGLCQRRIICRTSANSLIGTILGLLIFPCSLHSAFANEIDEIPHPILGNISLAGWDYTVAILDVVPPCLLPVIGRYNLNESSLFLYCYRKYNSSRRR
ncbi:transmembrane protein 211 [Dermochelys coriacea]|uniref:transmembrane protein 211 n=1 Tax=Dermochelys coriacea TaxID=27794 RepID=UPI0018E6F934|nr:transmembrane protein 211 [Dermochelys coriacea]